MNLKSSYYEIPIIELYGVSSENWISKSGYEGTTYYFMKIREKNGLLIQMQCLYFMIIHLITIIIEEQMLMHLGGLNCKIEELSRINFVSSW